GEELTQLGDQLFHIRGRDDDDCVLLGPACGTNDDVAMGVEVAGNAGLALQHHISIVVPVEAIGDVAKPVVAKRNANVVCPTCPSGQSVLSHAVPRVCPACPTSFWCLSHTCPTSCPRVASEKALRLRLRPAPSGSNLAQGLGGAILRKPLPRFVFREFARFE